MLWRPRRTDNILRGVLAKYFQMGVINDGMTKQNIKCKMSNFIDDKKHFSVKGKTQFSPRTNSWIMNNFLYLLPDGGPYHIETSPLIFSGSQWTGFYMVGNSIMKELKSEKFIRYWLQMRVSQPKTLGIFQSIHFQLFFYPIS